MNIEDWPVAQLQVDIYRQLEELDLLQNYLELQMFGFTVIPPEKMKSEALFTRMREHVLRVLNARTGEHHTLDSNELKQGPLANASGSTRDQSMLSLFRMLPEDSSFVEAAAHPMITALVRAMMQGTFQLSLTAALIRSRSDSWGDLPGKGLHIDAGGLSDPLPVAGHKAMAINTNWILTDYTMENGPIGFVPGSHQWCRRPVPGEHDDDIVGVEAAIGSVVVFQGYTWHTGLQKKTGGLRLSVNNYYCRSESKPYEDYRDDFTAEELKEYGPEFQKLVGEKVWLARSATRSATIDPELLNYS